MQIRVDQVTDVKTGQYGVSSKMIAGNDHYFVNDDATKYIGKTLEIEVSEKTSKTGNKYKIAKILREVAQVEAHANGNGKIPLAEWQAAMKAFHQTALELEPDEIDKTEGEDRVRIDRGQVRAAIVNTCLIAFSNGKISVELDESDMPF